MSARALSRSIKVPVNRITAILNGERGVTADTARRLSRYFGTSTEFWMNLQKSYEIRAAELADPQNSVDEIVPCKTALLRDGVRDLTLEKLPSQLATETLKTIECNLTLGTQLQTYEQMARIGDLNPAMVHTFEAPHEEIRDAGVFETGLADFSLTRLRVSTATRTSLNQLLNLIVDDWNTGLQQMLTLVSILPFRC